MFDDASDIDRFREECAQAILRRIVAFCDENPDATREQVIAAEGRIIAEELMMFTGRHFKHVGTVTRKSGEDE